MREDRTTFTDRPTPCKILFMVTCYFIDTKKILRFKFFYTCSESDKNPLKSKSTLNRISHTSNSFNSKIIKLLTEI